MLGSILTVVNIIFMILMFLYLDSIYPFKKFFKGAGAHAETNSRATDYSKLRKVCLNKPLSEVTRPSTLKEVVGQEDPVKALKAALCGPNPQHVILYGPPGVGKTAAARAVMEEARTNFKSLFDPSSPFVEIDATAVRFDERGIADPLIGSVHDPIYQGAGKFGSAGIPQPKAGAVTKAHGGVLFIDEIGELHPVQMNRLLKVLEDRVVFLESSYYNPEDQSIPKDIRDAFENGLPADFRLVGATTRPASDIPAALRSRCIEIYFNPLNDEQLGTIVDRSVEKLGVRAQEGVRDVIVGYANNGRDAVNIVQMAAGIAAIESDDFISKDDVEWVAKVGRYSLKPSRRADITAGSVGCVNSLAVCGSGVGVVAELEAVAVRCTRRGCGKVSITGIVEEEEMSDNSHVVRRKSMAKCSVESVMTALKGFAGLAVADYDIYLNFPGGTPVDGPSAGVSMAVAVYSAVSKRSVPSDLAFTGEVSIRGVVKPVGGVDMKVKSAGEVGIKKVFVPKENFREGALKGEGVEVVPVCSLQEVFSQVFDKVEDEVCSNGDACERTYGEVRFASQNEPVTVAPEGEL